MDLSPCFLEGSLVRLEPLSLRHLDGLCAVGLDPEIWRLTIAQVDGRGAMERYVVQALAEQRAGTALPFATVLQTSGEVIGSTRFHSPAPAHRRVEIGWTWLGRAWQRTGANTEAKYLMLRHAFEQWGCMRVEFKTSTLNERSRAALQRIGAVEEGVLRHHMINEDGTVRDSVYFSILLEEWPSVKLRLERMMSGRETTATGSA
jgi:N-acetyltransferase